MRKGALSSSGRPLQITRGYQPTRLADDWLAEAYQTVLPVRSRPVGALPRHRAPACGWELQGPAAVGFGQEVGR
jgi:hypothetical protein